MGGRGYNIAESAVILIKYLFSSCIFSCLSSAGIIIDFWLLSWNGGEGVKCLGTGIIFEFEHFPHKIQTLVRIMNHDLHYSHPVAPHPQQKISTVTELLWQIVSIVPKSMMFKKVRKLSWIVSCQFTTIYDSASNRWG
mmetsp:Transcript_16854/g.35307  ORF Transcript_16854/g.35307 Transcript_16854/m.35307 type:complete len:138 (-) Transcript_16854:330-743(-)